MPLKGFTDESRALLRVTGADARALLQDLVTNNLDHLSEDGLVYSALLTPQGKYLFDFLIGLGPDGAMLFDVAAEKAPAFAQRLAMYRLRRDMVIEATEIPVTLIWGSGAPPAGARADPRHPDLGWRVYGDADAALAGVEPASRADYDALRVRLAIPETGIELTDDTFILEAGFERLNGVDFRKGCYVGQEVTARMRHKTKLRKGLVRVSVEGEAAPGAAVEADGKPAGALLTVAGREGLAHLRYDRAGGEMKAGDATLRRID